MTTRQLFKRAVVATAFSIVSVAGTASLAGAQDATPAADVAVDASPAADVAVAAALPSTGTGESNNSDSMLLLALAGGAGVVGIAGYSVSKRTSR